MTLIIFRCNHEKWALSGYLPAVLGGLACSVWWKWFPAVFLYSPAVCVSVAQVSRRPSPQRGASVSAALQERLYHDPVQQLDVLSCYLWRRYDGNKWNCLCDKKTQLKWGIIAWRSLNTIFSSYKFPVMMWRKLSHRLPGTLTSQTCTHVSLHVINLTDWHIRQPLGRPAVVRLPSRLACGYKCQQTCLVVVFHTVKEKHRSNEVTFVCQLSSEQRNPSYDLPPKIITIHILWPPRGGTHLFSQLTTSYLRQQTPTFRNVQDNPGAHFIFMILEGIASPVNTINIYVPSEVWWDFSASLSFYENCAIRSARRVHSWRAVRTDYDLTFLSSLLPVVISSFNSICLFLQPGTPCRKSNQGNVSSFRCRQTEDRNVQRCWRRRGTAKSPRHVQVSGTVISYGLCPI